MRKNLLSLSFLAIVAISVGCGGDSTEPEVPTDTTAPEIINTAYAFDVEELMDKNVLLLTDDVIAQFSENSNDAKINASTLVFTAPAYIDGGANSYTVTVTATDGTNSSSKAFSFTVTEKIIAENYASDASYVATTVDKKFIKIGENLKGPSGLLWKNRASTLMTYTDAVTYCQNFQDWRIAKKSELLNLMDYSKGDNSGQSYLLDNDFTAIIDAGLSTSWVEGEFTVNYKSGVASVDIGSNSVLCVLGTASDEVHQLSEIGGVTVQDSTTNLEWTIVANPQYGETIVDALAQCQGDWSLPTINQLRSVIDYSDDTIPFIAADDANYSIWSSTEYKNNDRNSYFKVDLGNDANIGVDDDNQTHRVTCVRSF